MVLAGDFNANTRRWDPRYMEYWDATYCEEILDDHWLVLGNDDRPTHYWTWYHTMGESIIALTLAH